MTKYNVGDAILFRDNKNQRLISGKITAVREVLGDTEYEIQSSEDPDEYFVVKESHISNQVAEHFQGKQEAWIAEHWKEINDTYSTSPGLLMQCKYVLVFDSMPDMVKSLGPMCIFYDERIRSVAGKVVFVAKEEELGFDDEENEE